MWFFSGQTPCIRKHFRLRRNKSCSKSIRSKLSLCLAESDHFILRKATHSPEYRAAAYLRAATFYQVPADRSEYARRSFLRMKADHNWNNLELQVAGKDPTYKNVRVVPFIATYRFVEGDEQAELLHSSLPDTSCILPAEGSSPPEIVVGTLDLNQGSRLPAEELIGWHPSVGDRTKLSAYLSNVCVASGARRKGVGQLLIGAAIKEADRLGVQQLYVHVVADNTAACRLYLDCCGFAVEQEESEGLARSLNRPRRLLLGRSVHI